MKLFQFLNQDGQNCVGAKLPGGLVDLSSMARRAGVPLRGGLDEVIRDGTLDALKALAEDSPPLYLDESSLTFAPVVRAPSKILCVGTNYLAHIRETGAAIPEYPVIFSKFSGCVNHHRGVVKLPAAATKYDYEAELVIVMGRTAREVSEDDALSYAFGYTVGNDLSARDLQKRTSQWLLGKALDGFAPIGPYVDTDADPTNLDLRCYLNGALRQTGNTGDLIFSCAHLIHALSQFLTLEPGDLIFTGTPSGVIAGYPPQAQVWMKAGDVVTCEITQIGRLTVTLQ